MRQAKYVESDDEDEVLHSSRPKSKAISKRATGYDNFDNYGLDQVGQLMNKHESKMARANDYRHQVIKQKSEIGGNASN